MAECYQAAGVLDETTTCFYLDYRRLIFFVWFALNQRAYEAFFSWFVAVHPRLRHSY